MDALKCVFSLFFLWIVPGTVLLRNLGALAMGDILPINVIECGMKDGQTNLCNGAHSYCQDKQAGVCGMCEDICHGPQVLFLQCKTECDRYLQLKEQAEFKDSIMRSIDKKFSDLSNQQVDFKDSIIGSIEKKFSDLSNQQVAFQDNIIDSNERKISNLSNDIKKDTDGVSDSLRQWSRNLGPHDIGLLVATVIIGLLLMIVIWNNYKLRSEIKRYKTIVDRTCSSVIVEYPVKPDSCASSDSGVSEEKESIPGVNNEVIEKENGNGKVPTQLIETNQSPLQSSGTEGGNKTESTKIQHQLKSKPTDPAGEALLLTSSTSSGPSLQQSQADR